MAIDPNKLNALKALNQGGSAGFDSYQQAKQNEAASRTEALRGALGGQDIYQAAQAAQAKYAPKVQSTGLENASNLTAASDQYLSQAANKLAAQNYEQQQKLTLQGESLRRQQSEMSEADRLKYLQGAADQAAEADRAAFDATPVQQLAAQKQALRDQLTKMDASIRATGIASPEIEQARGDILRQMAATDQQFNAAATGFTGALGTDAQELLGAYGTDNAANVQGLVSLLNPKVEEANRRIDVEGQKRLRELAPAFGIDPMKASGMFREGQSDDLATQGRLAEERAYVSGHRSQKDQDAAAAEVLGMAPDTFKSVRTATRMKPEQVVETMQTSNWNELADLTTGYMANGGAGGNTGVEGYRAFVSQNVQGATHEDGSPLSDKEKDALINMATAYYVPIMQRSFGKGEAE